MIKDVKFHRIEGTNKEWIEYPTEMYLAQDPQNEDYTILVCANVLKNQPALIQELKELYGDEVDIIEKWIRIEVLRTPTGKIVRSKNIVHNCTPPIVDEGFTHSLSFHGKDENYLKFIKWDIEKKLADRNKLAKLDISTPKEETAPSFKIEGGEHTGDIELPSFLTKEKKELDNSFKSLDEVFESMDALMNSFFNNFPKF